MKTAFAEHHEELGAAQGQLWLNKRGVTISTSFCSFCSSAMVAYIIQIKVGGRIPIYILFTINIYTHYNHTSTYNLLFGSPSCSIFIIASPFIYSVNIICLYFINSFLPFIPIRKIYHDIKMPQISFYGEVSVGENSRSCQCPHVQQERHPTHYHSHPKSETTLLHFSCVNAS